MTGLPSLHLGRKSHRGLQRHFSQKRIASPGPARTVERWAEHGINEIERSNKIKIKKNNPRGLHRWDDRRVIFPIGSTHAELSMDGHFRGSRDQRGYYSE